MAMSKLARGGFECEFVETPTKFFQTECPICLQILRNPYQVVCCGKSYCQSCIERIKKDRKSCPHCNKQNFTDFPNKGLRQSLYQCPVYCSNKEEGCKWSGELGELDKHLNLEPPAARQLEGCDFATVKCIHCKKSLQRQHIETHQTEKCPNRPFCCEYCHTYKSTYHCVVKTHIKNCGCVPVQCTNGCRKSFLRQALNTHIARDCPLTVVDCDFHYAGCDVMLPRKDMPEHLTTAMVTHMSLVAVCNNTLLARVEELKRENKALREDVAHLKKFHPIPTDIIMPNVMKHKQSDKIWPSPSFYTHYQGYKLVLAVWVNGHDNAKGKYMSLTICTIPGEFDEIVQWPFQGVIIVQVLASQDSEHFTCTIEITSDKVREGANHVIGGNKIDFLEHEKLKNYIHNDTLRFRIVKFTQKAH